MNTTTPTPEVASDHAIRMQAARVAIRRAEVEGRNQHLATLRAAWEAEHQPLIDELSEAKASLSESETELRRMVEEAHYETGAKAFPAGIKVRTVTKFVYDEDRARAFAAKHKPELLILDKKAFEKLVKANDSAVGNPEWIQVAAVAQATIPADLESALNGGAE